MTLEPQVVHRLRELLELAEYEPHTITMLTDEELVAIERDVASTPHPSPWIAQTPRVDRELAGQFGLRSLLVRGLLRAVDDSGSEPVLDVPPEVRVVLDTRRIGLGYIRATRPHGDSGASKIMVVQPELGAFEEEISIRGFHLFSACSYDAATSRMARWCLPHEYRVRPGGVTRLAEADWPAFLHAELPNAKVTDLSLELYLPDRDGNREPEQWVVAYDESIAVVASATSSGLLVRATTAEHLRDLLDDRIALALKHAHSPRRTP